VTDEATSGVPGVLPVVTKGAVVSERSMFFVLVSLPGSELLRVVGVDRLLIRGLLQVRVFFLFQAIYRFAGS